MRSGSYVVLDTETTGLRPGYHSLTELCAMRVDGCGNVQERFSSLINPGHHIPSFITQLTGIDDEMVRDAPSADVVIRQFSSFVRESDILVGHNLRFDLGFLHHELAKQDLVLRNRTLCTMRLARRVFARDPLTSYRLGVLAAHLDVPVPFAHRAEVDVRTTIGVVQRLFEQLEMLNMVSSDDVLALQFLPLAKASKLLSPSDYK